MTKLEDFFKKQVGEKFIFRVFPIFRSDSVDWESQPIRKMLCSFVAYEILSSKNITCLRTFFVHPEIFEFEI